MIKLLVPLFVRIHQQCYWIEKNNLREYLKRVVICKVKLLMKSQNIFTKKDNFTIIINKKIIFRLELNNNKNFLNSVKNNNNKKNFSFKTKVLMKNYQLK